MTSEASTDNTADSKADSTVVAEEKVTTETGPAETPTMEELAAKYAALKKESDKWEARSKSNFDKATAWDDYQQAQKPVEQQNAERLAALETENRELKLSVVKSAIATKYGFNEAALRRLSGSTAEELEADAQELSELLNSKPAVAKPTVKPVTTQGNQPDASPVGGKAKSKAELMAFLKSQQ